MEWKTEKNSRSFKEVITVLSILLYIKTAPIASIEKVIRIIFFSVANTSDIFSIFVISLSTNWL